MAQTNVSIRMDEDLKRQFSALCEELGMNMTTAVCIFAKKAVREQRIPFDVSADPFYSKENIAELERRIAGIKDGTRVLKEHDLIEVDDQ